MIGFSSTVLHTVPASPPQYVAPALLIASCMNTAELVLPSCPMSTLPLLAPKGPAQRVTALHSRTSGQVRHTAMDTWCLVDGCQHCRPLQQLCAEPLLLTAVCIVAAGCRSFCRYSSGSAHHASAAGAAGAAALTHKTMLPPGAGLLHSPHLFAVEVCLQVCVGGALSCVSSLQRPGHARYTEACSIRHARGISMLLMHPA